MSCLLHVGREGQVHEASEENKHSSESVRDHSWYIVVKTMAVFYLCTKILSEAEFKSNIFNGLAEDMAS